MNQFDWDHGFLVDFDVEKGFSDTAASTKRTVKDMRDMFLDTDAADKLIADGDPLIYEFYELGCPSRDGDILFGATVLYPGKVGDEYFMTKGHFHTKLETAEVYYTLAGEGYMVLENPEGETKEFPLSKGQAVYCPRRFAHRTVNIGDEPMVLFFAFDANAGHDYGTIETKGYHKLIVEKDGKPTIIDNPKWK